MSVGVHFSLIGCFGNEGISQKDEVVSTPYERSPFGL